MSETAAAPAPSAPAATPAPAPSAPAPSASEGRHDSSGGAKPAGTEPPRGTPTGEEKPRARAAEAKQEAAEAKPAAEPKRFSVDEYGDHLVELTVNGRKQEVTVKEALRLQQLERASRSALEESAQVRKQHEQLMASLKESPAKVLSQLGPEALRATLDQVINSDDPAAQKVVQDYFTEIVERAQWTPEQKLQHELKERDAKLERYEKAEQDKRTQAQVQEMVPQLEQQFVQALKARGLPATPDTLDAMAEQALMALEQGRQPTYEALAEAVENIDRTRSERYLSRLNDLSLDDFGKYAGKRLAALKPEEIVQLLGEDKHRELREWQIAQVRAEERKAERKERRAGGYTPTQSNEKPPMSLEQIREMRAARRAKRYGAG